MAASRLPYGKTCTTPTAGRAFLAWLIYNRFCKSCKVWALLRPRLQGCVRIDRRHQV
ncbi:MAG: hypothetical protein ACKON9_07180 [Planctomycetaceae bacterium]